MTASPSLCDRCFSPGACCKSMVLTRGVGEPVVSWDGDTPETELAKLIGPHPFEATDRTGTWVAPDDHEDAGRSYSAHAWTCTALAKDGRCGIYDSRPQLCRDYEAGSSPLCVHFGGAEGGEAEL